MLKRYDALFTGAAMVLVGLAVWEARAWDTRAQLFPWAIGFPLLALLAVQLTLTLRSRSTATLAATMTPEGVEPGTAVRRTGEILAWVLAFALAVWALGFPIGCTLATLAYLKVAAREAWSISLGIAAGTAVFFWLLVSQLYVPFPPGFLLAPFTAG